MSLTIALLIALAWLSISLAVALLAGRLLHLTDADPEDRPHAE